MTAKTTALIAPLLLAAATVGDAAGRIVVQTATGTSASREIGPDLSGTWRIVRSETTGAPVYGDAFRATQSRTELRLDLAIGGLSYQARYNLDGTESSYDARPGAQLTAVAHWEDGALVIVSRTFHPGGVQEATRRLRLTGNTLVVETTAGGQGAKTVSVYKR